MARSKVKKNKLAAIPKGIWEDRLLLAHNMNEKTAIEGFRLYDKIMKNEFKLERKIKKNGKKIYVFFE
tara:strand:- start:188 stop:391 length:204 start_codon:yes stop_codon:yes gene_type:complete